MIHWTDCECDACSSGPDYGDKLPRPMLDRRADDGSVVQGSKLKKQEQLSRMIEEDE